MLSILASFSESISIDDSTCNPVRGGATISPRWPLPMGATKSMIRAERSLND